MSWADWWLDPHGGSTISKEEINERDEWRKLMLRVSPHARAPWWRKFLEPF